MPLIDGRLSEAVDEERGRYRLLRSLALNRKDGSVMVYVPAGEFEMGDGKDTDCPTHRVYLDGYWIGVYCVTNRQYAKFVADTRRRAPDNQRWNQAAYGDYPVVNVSWEEAVEYGEWAGCALATEAQWEKAARGPKGLIYPWGNECEGSRCRSYNNRGNEETAAVWAYGRGGSGWGTYNQSGNVWEWCADRYDDEYYGKSPGKNPTGPTGFRRRVCRGGSWRFDDGSRFRGACRYGGDPSYRYDGRGFRLVRKAA